MITKIFNVVLFISLIVVSSISFKSNLPFPGYFDRYENIFILGEESIGLDTRINILPDSKKYTSIVNISDGDGTKIYNSFVINGDIFIENGDIVAITNDIEQMNELDVSSIYIASSSPIVRQIQKSMLGVDVFKKRTYEFIFINDSLLCYADLKTKIIRCLAPKTRH